MELPISHLSVRTAQRRHGNFDTTRTLIERKVVNRMYCRSPGSWARVLMARTPSVGGRTVGCVRSEEGIPSGPTPGLPVALSFRQPVLAAAALSMCASMELCLLIFNWGASSSELYPWGRKLNHERKKRIYGWDIGFFFLVEGGRMKELKWDRAGVIVLVRDGRVNIFAI